MNEIQNTRRGYCRTAAVLTLVMLSACTTSPKMLTDKELIAARDQDIATMFGNVEPISQTLTLSQAIARAIKYNLDHRVQVMKEALALGQSDLSRFDLLPKLTANAGYSGRDEFDVTGSRNLNTHVLSTADPTYSADREHITADLTASWNILDFGVSYFAAQQSGDRALIATERRRKVLHNLNQEVRYAYWRLVAAQVLKKKVSETIQMAKEALDNAETVASEGLSKPLEALRFQKTLLETIRQLETINQELSTAHIELATLINVPPGSEIHVVEPKGDILKGFTWDVPVGDMEKVAFLNNPDIREKMYEARISVKETKKAILSLLPGITLSGGRNYDGDNLLEANWTCPTLVPPPYLVQAAFNSNASGLFPPNAEWRLRGL